MKGLSGADVGELRAGPVSEVDFQKLADQIEQENGVVLQDVGVPRFVAGCFACVVDVGLCDPLP